MIYKVKKSVVVSPNVQKVNINTLMELVNHVPHHVLNATMLLTIVLSVLLILSSTKTNVLSHVQMDISVIL